MQVQEKRILVINPGSTSTKIGVFHDDRSIFEKSIRHDEAELQQYQTIIDQYSFRKQAILETLHEQGINISKLMPFAPGEGCSDRLKAALTKSTMR